MKTSQDTKMRLKLGIYSLTSCYGCQLKIATLSRILDVANSVDVRCFYMLSSDGSINESVDIAIVEGSVSTEKDLVELKEIRSNAKRLIAVGACAINGGVQSWVHNEKSYTDLYNCVYGEAKIKYIGLKAHPIDNYVKVDFYLPGCPPEEGEIMYYLSTFLFGTWPETKDYPVCHECRVAENPCILIESGEPCLGSITVAGCGARCIKYNIPCVGCRGPVPHNNAWFDSLARAFKEKGYSEEYIYNRIAIFNSHEPNFKGRLANFSKKGV
ncbi:NADH-quinone oxidoreductase subunit B family protein [Candidatus Hodarchaeum mangrovi]